MRKWIEIVIKVVRSVTAHVLPRMREWIEIDDFMSDAEKKLCSPSYEGVD